MGQVHLIEALTRVKDCFNSFPLDRLALVGSAAAMDDHAHFERTRQAVIHTRTRLTGALRELGFEVPESSANFVFARHRGHRGAVLLSALREQGILVRRFDQPARIADFLRISIGTDAECDQLLAALSGWLAAHPLD
jgi:histidinol-phosphate aminotransferase